jgi:hypothetical protein
LKVSLLFFIGSGTSNDGNSARRFFADPTITARITGLDERLLRRFAIILQTITSAEMIDVNAYENFAQETAKLYVDVYGWYHMPPTLHKILIHGSEIINNFDMPIGILSEEAQEATNKIVRRVKIYGTRKCSRIAANQDLLNFMVVSSDPVINTRRQITKKKKTRAIS